MKEQSDNVPKTKSCILCPYKHESECLDNHEKCYSLSNIYYGIIYKHFPFKQIDNFITNRQYNKYYKDMDRMDKKYGDINKEDDDFKFIWGIKSYDDLCSAECGLQTMNDFDIIYLKNENKYIMGLETIYMFDSKQAEYCYLKAILDHFTKYMINCGLNVEKCSYGLYNVFTESISMNKHYDSIEDCYWSFRIMVNGYCNLC
jgi:hypothetical protein